MKANLNAVALFVLSVGTSVAPCRAESVPSAVRALAVKEGTPLVIPDAAEAQTVELNWVVPTDRPAFVNILDRLGSSWKDGKLNLSGIASTIVHPGGNQFYSGSGFTNNKNHLLVFHYNLTDGATLTPSDAAYAAPDATTYPLTGSGWFYEVRKPSNGYSGWWTFAANGGSGYVDAAYMINIDQLKDDGVISSLSIGELVEKFGGRMLLPGQNGTAQAMPRNGGGKIVQTLTVTDANGIARQVTHAADAGKASFVLYPGDTLSVDCGSVVFRAALPVASTGAADWSAYKWGVVGDSLSDPTLSPVGQYYYDLIGAYSGIRLSVNGKGSSGHWAMSESGYCFSQRARLLPPDADVVTVFGSVNDWKYYQKKVPLGTATDVLSETVTVGAYINETIRVVREKAPLAKIVMITGLYYYGVNGTYAGNVYALQKSIADLNPDIRFVDWINGQNAQGYDFPNADQYEFKQIDRDTYGSEFASTYTRDYTATVASYGHPSAAYHAEWLAPAFSNELNRVIVELRKLQPVPPPSTHTHAWTVNVVGAMLTATCQNGGCSVGQSQVSIGGTGFKVVDGQPLAVTVEGAETFAGETGGTVGTVVYKQGETVLPGPPASAGSYTANVTVTLDGTDHVLVKPLVLHAHAWTLTRKDATFVATCGDADGLCPSNLVEMTVVCPDVKTATGEPVAATLVGREGFETIVGATVTVTYRSGGVVLDEPPVSAGDYEVSVSVSVPGTETQTYTKAYQVKDPPAQQMAVYLKSGATGAADGTTWDDAFTDPASALASSFAKGLPLYVAKGVYVVSNTLDLTQTFAIYGGFRGEDVYESLESRDPAKYPSVFTGDQDLDNVWYHCVPDETKAAMTLTETTEPLFRNGAFNPPPAYTTDYDTYYTVTKGTDTLRCFKAAVDVGGMIDGLVLVAFGVTTTSCSGSGLYAPGPLDGKTSPAIEIVVRNVDFIGFMSPGGAVVTEQHKLLTIDVVGCRFLHFGTTYNNNGNTLVGLLRCKGRFRDCRIESVMRKPGNGATSGILGLTVRQISTRGRGVDVTGCTFCRCASYGGVNVSYGGTCNVFGYGNDSLQGTAFCDNTVSNCYTASTGAGQVALVALTCSESGNSGANNSGTYRGLRFENNLSLMKTAANCCWTMVGLAAGGDYAARYSLADSVFRRNRIHAYGTTADDGTTVALAIAGSNSKAPAMFTMVNCVFDANEASVDATSHAGVTAILSRGVADAQYAGAEPTATACMGLANCTFVGPRVDGVHEVIQTGAHAYDCTLVNCLFNLTDASAYAEPCWFSTPSTVKAYTCSTNAISVDKETYRPTACPHEFRASATVVTNSAAVVYTSNVGGNYPVTYSFTPYGGSTALPLCPALTSAAGDLGVIGDLYGEPRKRNRLTRGAVQNGRFGLLVILR